MYMPDHSSAFAPEAARLPVPAQSLPAKFIAAQVEVANPKRVARFFSRIGRWYATWQNRRAVAGLLHLDDYLLRDIGLSRSDVSSALSLRRTEDPSDRLRQAAEDKRGRRGQSPAAAPPAPRSLTSLSGELF